MYCILTTLATNISLLPLWRNCLILLTYTTFLILSKKLIFITSYDIVNFLTILAMYVGGDDLTGASHDL